MPAIAARAAAADNLPARSARHRDAHDHDREQAQIHAPASLTGRVRWIALTAGFGIVEAVGGWFAGSLALISDAGHTATDAAAFVVALIAQSVARRPPSRHASFGVGIVEGIGLRVSV